MEQDMAMVQNRFAKAVQAVRDARESLNSAIREIADDGTIVREIDQFTAREACSVLAALRLLQIIQDKGGVLPSEIKAVFSRSSPGAVTRLADMEHFETEAPLSVMELEDLCERIDVDFTR